ncbi:MAG: glycosyltransferase family 4 protein [Paludibacter sp.]|nr:glycosyltransferase family 4 protein [Paludibacter sp.]MDD4198404.1 glycosyltransferase family 4 protein [Paludibacter sp.]MDD4427082.1 glycosyltransferase family 4 protein [Paludibacter sp.]
MIELCFLNISSRGSTTGVDRYLSVLIEGLHVYRKEINILLVDFVYNDKILFSKYKEYSSYRKLTIPLPQRYSNFLNETYWMDKYFEVASRLLLPYLKEDMIYHVSSFNLILLALKLKERLKGKIISHVHFIPWKEHYEHNKSYFNKLYAHYHSNTLETNIFFINKLEKDFYEKADKIICVTSYGRNFVHRLTGIPSTKIEIITNGIEDSAVNQEKIFHNSDNVEILFAGRVCEGKGIFFALEALSIVRKEGYDFKFIIAGVCEDTTKLFIREKYHDLNVDILDNIDFDTLKRLYSSVNIGILPSLKEQASYVAIEMAMFGLPVICTAIDGLDEIFTNDKNVLKVPAIFSKIKGLTIDIDTMANKIISLIENKRLCSRLSTNIRNLYEQEFTLPLMIEKTITVYEKLINKE